jgi:hypothetical protein
MTIDRTVLDTTKDELLIAACPRRDIAAEHSADVATWLQMLGGQQHHTDLLTWLRWVGALDKSLACLYVKGAKGTGKTLLAHGLARLWSEAGATPATAVSGDYHDLMTRCPLVLADEAFPAQWTGKHGGARFREFIAAPSRMQNPKGLPAVMVEGYPRVIAAANNDSLIQMRESLTPEDRAAIEERIFYLEVPVEAASFLASLERAQPGRLDHFASHEIAAHVTWIEDELNLPRQGRFGVRAQSSKVHEQLKYAHAINAATAEWIIGYILHPDRWHSACAGGDSVTRRLVLVDAGRLNINVRAMRSQGLWEMYVSSPRAVPHVTALSAALVEWSDGRAQHGGTKYRSINVKQIAAFAESQQLATEAELRDALAVISRRSQIGVVR